ncbi:MAG: diguanylate cyclase, partial [Anaerolineales bacterium]
FYRNNSQDDRDSTLLLCGVSKSMAVLAVLLFIEEYTYTIGNIISLYLQPFVLSIVLLLVIQFAYRYPVTLPRYRRESKHLLVISIVYATLELIIMVDRLARLSHGGFGIRPEIADYPLVIGLVWVMIVLLRRSVKASGLVDGGRKIIHLFKPQGEAARSTHSLLGIILIGLLLSTFNLITSKLVISSDVYDAVMNFGFLILISSFVSVYTNNIADLLKLRERLVGAAIVTNLIVLTTLAWGMLIPQASHDLYPELNLTGKSYQFIQNPDSSYSRQEIQSADEDISGEKISGTYQVATLPFSFNFYGKDYSEVWIFRDGTLRFELPYNSVSYQVNYGDTPAIYALQYEPAGNYDSPDVFPDTGVFYQVDQDRLIVTWNNLPEQLAPEAQHTFQAVLYADGVIEFHYLDVNPDPMRISNISSRLGWFSGVTPGNQFGRVVPLKEFSQNGVQGESGEALIQDFRYMIKSRQHPVMEVVGYTMAFSTLLISLLFPLNLEKSVIQPVEEIVSSIEKVTNGQNEDAQANGYQDEIGMISRAFETMQAEKDFQQSEPEDQIQTFSRIFERSPNAVMIVDNGFHIQYVNAMFVELTGFSMDEVRMQTPNILTSGKTLMGVYRKLWLTIIQGEVWRGEVINRRKNGEDYWAGVVVAPIKGADSKTSHYVWVIDDITERKNAEEELLQLSITDPLTGIFNRRQLFVLGETAFEQAVRYETPLCILMMDVDHFKQVNDTYGHQKGDEILVALANIVKEKVRKADVFGRYGGEEFMVIMPNTDQEGALVAAEHLREVVEGMSLETDTGEIRITISVGICEFQPGHEVLEQVINGADQALYSAKQTGRNKVVACSGEGPMLWQPDVF